LAGRIRLGAPDHGSKRATSTRLAQTSFTMLFNSASFLCFLPVAFAAYWLWPGNFGRKLFLVAASCFFYAAWDWRFLGLLGLVIVTTFAASRLILDFRKRKKPIQSLLVLWTCVGLQLTVLGFFKYFNFFEDNLAALLSTFGLPPASSIVRVLLPVGISFYTFHAITLAVDTFRGKVETRVSFLDVALYIAFFPQLVAGPIVRATVFLPQLVSRRSMLVEDFFAAAQAIVTGFLYKVVFADSIAPFVDQVFAQPADYSGILLLAASFGFYCQIYFDFNGYSMIAIGVSRLFGYKLPDNFDFPYGATSLGSFWRRWHISLSSWLRDYLYIPLGGNRLGGAKQIRNLIMTMLLGGIWHGANWNFVIWGAAHGSLLAVERFSRIRHGTTSNEESRSILSLAFGWLITQSIVLLLWIPFRAKTLADSWAVFSGIFSWRPAVAGAPLAIPVALLVLPIFCDTVLVRLLRSQPGKPLLRPELGLGLLTFCGLAVGLIAKTGLRSFIYFQF
jgi:alginate O-acetyltransferase complex protein AlgI